MRYMTTTNRRPVSVMDQLLDSMLYETPSVKSSWKTFSVDIIEDGDQYLVSAELPGFEESEVDVTLNDNLMVISAAKENPSKDSGTEEGDLKEDVKVKYLLRERAEGQYKRSFALPKDADRETIKASLKDGILNLSIGKKPEAKPLSIKIN
ncbi:MAG: Hsp20/alpha crystallin family protein [Spirochaetaceae bacterium]|jgi:HSP20 family protein|nr:Hsp20/alpha crystallin family protein [Spirochaetaceae bacterium]